MDRLIATNSVASGSADTAPVSGTPQYATSGNPATNTPATVFPAYQYNALQEELMAIITAGGITADRTNNAQVIAAIRNVITGYFTGSNQNLASSGYQKLPGGLIIEWGIGTLTSGTTTITYPLALPNALLGFVAFPSGTNITLASTSSNTSSATINGWTASSGSAAPNATTFSYIIIGK